MPPDPSVVVVTVWVIVRLDEFTVAGEDVRRRLTGVGDGVCAGVCAGAADAVVFGRGDVDRTGGA